LFCLWNRSSLPSFNTKLGSNIGLSGPRVLFIVQTHCPLLLRAQSLSRLLRRRRRRRWRRCQRSWGLETKGRRGSARRCRGSGNGGHGERRRRVALCRRGIRQLAGPLRVQHGQLRMVMLVLVLVLMLLVLLVMAVMMVKCCCLRRSRRRLNELVSRCLRRLHPDRLSWQAMRHVAAPVGVLVHGAVAVWTLAVRADTGPSIVAEAVALCHSGIRCHGCRAIDGVVHPRLRMPLREADRTRREECSMGRGTRSLRVRKQ
jgi:hypothetical protein